MCMREAPHGNNKNVHLLRYSSNSTWDFLNYQRRDKTDTGTEIKHGNVLCLLNVKTFVTNGKY